MKKLLLIFTLVAGCYSLSYSQTKTLKAIFDEFKGEEKVMFIGVDKNMLSAMSASISNEDSNVSVNISDGERDMLESIDAATMLMLSDCEQSIKDRFTEAVSELDFTGYDQLVRVTQDNQLVKIYGKVDGETVHDVAIVITGDVCVLGVVDGTIKLSDVGTMASSINIK